MIILYYDVIHTYSMKKEGTLIEELRGILVGWCWRQQTFDPAERKVAESLAANAHWPTLYHRSSPCVDGWKPLCYQIYQKWWKVHTSYHRWTKRVFCETRQLWDGQQETTWLNSKMASMMPREFWTRNSFNFKKIPRTNHKNFAKCSTIESIKL